ncbi:hypothetical protein [Paraliobacillus sp. JSM ZJ581]
MKIQRPNIKKQILTDLEILHELADQATHRVNRLKKFQLNDHLL